MEAREPLERDPRLVRLAYGILDLENTHPDYGTARAQAVRRWVRLLAETVRQAEQTW